MSSLLYEAGLIFLLLASVHKVLFSIGEYIYIYIGCPFGGTRNINLTSYTVDTNPRMASFLRGGGGRGD